MAPKASFSFRARLSKAEGVGPFVRTIVYIPPSVMSKLPQSRVRVKGTMNGAPFALAVQYRKNTASYFIVGAPLRKAARVKEGDMLDVRFSIVSDKVEIPEELQAALEQDPEGMKAWESITPGLQRGLCHYVNAVKNVDSRITRALFLVNKAKQGAYTKPPKEKNE